MAADGVYSFSKTAASNPDIGGVAVTVGAMAPSNVGPAFRALAAILKKWQEDFGAALTTTGSANAYLLDVNSNPYAGALTYADGDTFSFIASFTNSGAATLNVESEGAKAIRKLNDQALASGDIVSGSSYTVHYDASANGAAGAWLIDNAIGNFQPLDADLTSWAAITRAAGFDTFVTTPSSANLAALVTDETGTGPLVLATSPALTTPNLGTPSAGVLTNATGLPVSTGISGLGTGVATALAVNVGSAGAPVVLNGALGTPSSGTLTSATGLPIATGVSGLGTGVATALAVNVGSAGAPVVNGGALGTPSSGALTSATGLPLTTGVTGQLPIANGGTSGATATAGFNALSPVTTRGDIIVRDATNNVRLALGASGKVLKSDGTDAVWGYPHESFVIACSDETTAITATTGKVEFRMPYAFTVTAVRASLTTAQVSGSIFTVDINESGTTILSTKLTIDNAAKTSTTAATATVISDTSLADDAIITIDVDQIGNGTAKGLKVSIIGQRT